MKNIYKLVAILSIGILGFSCEPLAEFDYKSATPQIEEIAKIDFSPGHHALIADGNASLEMVVDIYRNFTYETASGEKRDTLVWVNPEQLPTDALKIYHAESGNEVKDFSYSTTDATPGIATFYAKIGDVESEHKPVLLRATPELPEKRIINVVFHIFELSPNDPTYNKYSAKEVRPELLVKAIDDLNDVYNNRLGNSANGTSTNLEFQLATLDNKGFPMDDPGFHLFYYNHSEMIKGGYDETTLQSSDFKDWVNNNDKEFIWNPDKYVNVIVVPIQANYDLSNAAPLAQIVETGGNQMVGMGDPIASEDDFETVLEKNSPYRAYGIAVAKNLFFPGNNKRITLCQEFAYFWGIRQTGPAEANSNDYCTDTRKWPIYEPNDDFQSVNFNKLQTSGVLRLGWDAYKFKCNNVMDDIRYPSLRHTVTMDQVERIRYALDNCPGRRPGR